MKQQLATAPFFSIVIPSYNRIGFLPETLDSILKQTFQDFEILVVDDGSTDHTPEILRHKYGHLSNFRLIEQPNAERGAARNHGFREASGSYVIFIDSDDLMLPENLEVLRSHILRLNQPDFIATKFLFLRNGKTRPTEIHFLPEGWYDYKLFLSGNPMGCNVCVRKGNTQLHLFEEDRRYAIKEDWMFLLQNLRHQQLYLIDRSTILMNDHDDRSMRSDHTIIIQKTRAALEWFHQQVELTEEDSRLLRAHAAYFSAIYYYVDHKLSSAREQLREAIRLGGWKRKYLVLWLKCLLGRTVIDQIKRIRS